MKVLIQGEDMSLMNEIQALRAQIDANARDRSIADAKAVAESAPEQTASGAPDDQPDVETLLTMVDGTLDEFAQELDKYPRLTALAALGIGLAVGIVIGRQRR